MNMKPVLPTTRKDIDIPLGTKKALTLMAINANPQTNLKNFIEAELMAMGDRGIPYTELWNECAALRTILRDKTEANS